MQHAARDVREELLRWLRSWRFTVHALEGRTRGGQPLTILYAGSAPYRHYLRALAFPDRGRERALGRYWRWQLPALALSVGAGVRVTRCARALRRLVRGTASFYVPEWLWCEMALDHKMAARTGKPWSGIRRHGLAYSVTSDAAALRHFYDRMYLPLVKASHGEAAQLMGRDVMLRRAAEREAELVSIWKGDVAVAGCFIVYENGGARMFSQGVLDGDVELLRQRVGVAVYLYSFVHLLERGFTSVNLGRSRPFLTDGVLRFKLERGAEVCGATRDGIHIELSSPSLGATEVVCANPWVGLDDEGLVATFFTRPEAPAAALEPPVGVGRSATVPISATPVHHPQAELASCR